MHDAPGVYVEGAKVAALGLRIKNGCSYHGLSLNVDMDLRRSMQSIRAAIPGLAVTQLRDLGDCRADGTRRRAPGVQAGRQLEFTSLARS